jgi:hypothetical protein
VDVAQFRTHYPEFKSVPQDYTLAKLIEATIRMGGSTTSTGANPDMRTWGSYGAPGQPLTLADMAQAAWAAHLLICSPFGSEVRLSAETTNSVYKDKWMDYAYAVFGGFLVSGNGGCGWPGRPF